ncbi:MAG: hypothetical protein KDC26_05430 [Armatimonadetes bacterium]|nr:hypothetical protein [Armatimonadota bacterium]
MFRPCNQAELDLVAESGYTAWPPRLPEQPIFYPVTNLQYAREINEWNITQFGHGFVTRFCVRKAFSDRYSVQTVGRSDQTEWWIPAEDLDELNRNIVGKIEVVEEFPVKIEPPK